MKRILLPALLLVMAGFSGVQAQQHPDALRDHTWILGYNQWWGPQSNGIKLDFNQYPREISPFNHEINMDATNGVISDIAGNLLFYSNGMRVADQLGRIMPNGDSMNYGFAFDWMEAQHRGYAVLQGLVILPAPNSSNLFYIIYSRFDRCLTCTSGWVQVGLYYSIVDMTLNEGFGDVTQKDVPLVIDSLPFGGLTAVRHGNGRDWWLLAPRLYHDQYYTLLLDPEGLRLAFIQEAGTENTHDEVTGAVFTPDGSRYIRVGDSVKGKPIRINIFDFDRCTGLLSNFTDASGYCSYNSFYTPSVSPNSRYLYFSNETSILQFDLQAADIAASARIVATWDGFRYLNVLPTAFGASALGPDGKIYFNAGHTPFLHELVNPDDERQVARVYQRSVELPYSAHFGIPTMPNFRLGRLAGSPCDTLGIYWGKDELTGPTVDITVSPNPCYDRVRFSLSVMNNNFRTTLQLVNTLGQVIETHSLSPFQGVLDLDVSHLAAGAYVAVLSRDATVLGRARFVVGR